MTTPNQTIPANRPERNPATPRRTTGTAVFAVLLLAIATDPGWGQLIPSTPAAKDISAANNPSARRTVTVDTRTDMAVVPAGGELLIAVDFTLPPKFHLYSPTLKHDTYLPTSIIVKNGDTYTQKRTIFPPDHMLDAFGEYLPVIEAGDNNILTAYVVVQATDDTTPGDSKVTMELNYQACSDTTCLPPVRNKQISIPVTIVDASASAHPSEQHDDIHTGYEVTLAAVEHADNLDTGAASGTTDKGSSSDGGFQFQLFGQTYTLRVGAVLIPLVVAFFAGVLLNIMPCVLPVIPIKVLSFFEHANESRLRTLMLGLMFSLGIITFFLGLGIIAAVLGESLSWGGHFRNPWFLIGMALLMVLLSLGLFGLYNVRVPGSVAGAGGGSNGYGGAVGMGLLAGVLSTPCSFGILGAAVGWALAQPGWMTILAFSTIGVGMAAPYVVLTGFPQLASRVPRAGRWSELVKQAMGFVLLAVAAFLLASLESDRLMGALLYMVVFGFGVWLYGQLVTFDASATRAWISRVVIISALVLFGWWLLPAHTSAVNWREFDTNDLKATLAEGRPVVIDFTADWCLNCKYVEKTVYGNRKVADMIASTNTVAMKADLTSDNPPAQQLLRTHSNQEGIPYSILFLPVTVDSNDDPQVVLLPGVFGASQLVEPLEEFANNTQIAQADG